MLYKAQQRPDPSSMPLDEPNLFAYVMLLAWPLVAVVLYTKLDPARALIWTILGGYLLLPPVVAIDFPVVPDLRKESIPNLMALVASLYVLRDRVPVLPDGAVGRVLICLFVLSPFATVLTNGDPLPFNTGVPGMRIYDSVAAVANQAIFLMPFFLARRYLGTPQAMQALLAAFVAGGLAYSLPMLIEVRFSPQMNVWIYGFFQHDFFQTIRGGGYRPVVFLPHGLWVAFFALMALLAAVLALRAAPAPARPKHLAIAVYLAVMLVLCRSAGPLIYAVVAAPLILLAPRRVQLWVAAGLAVVVVLYPLLRGLQVIPVERIIAAAQMISPERAGSLAFRVTNEEQLLARAAERPWFGWGGYGRNLLHDPVTGREVSIVDGEWAIQIGIYGWLGYIAEFGLLALPLILLLREAVLQRGLVVPREACGMALILAVSMVDLLPNATIVGITWLMAGALMGYAEALIRDRKVRAALDRVTLRHGRTVI